MQSSETLLEDGQAKPNPVRSASPDTSSSEVDPSRAKRTKARDALIAGCVANFGVQYNFTILAIALLFLEAAHGGDGVWYTDDLWAGQAGAVLKSSSFVGAMLGMCTMGYLGDVIGRNSAFAVTSLLMAVFALLSGLVFAPEENGDQAMGMLLAARFVLGIGIGGCYPLASSKGSEECGSDNALQKNQAVGLIFFWQAVGDLFPYLIGMALAPLHHTEDPLGHIGQFRVALCIGAVPPLVVLWYTYGQQDGRDTSQIDHAALAKRTWSDQVRAGSKEPGAWNNFLATSICWCFYDVAYYGSNQFTPKMTEQVFGDESSIFNESWKGAVDMAVGIPATLHALWLLRDWGTKRVQTRGHFAIAITAVLVACVWTPLTADDASQAMAYVLFMVYLLFYYAVNWGAKMGCFVLPQEVYASEFSGTFSGIAAAFGKFGAIVGIWTFEGLTPVIGLIPVMLIVAALATISGCISQNCISDRLWEVQKQQMKAAREGAIAASISSNAANEIASPLHPGGALDEEEPVAIN